MPRGRSIWASLTETVYSLAFGRRSVRIERRFAGDEAAVKVRRGVTVLGREERRPRPLLAGRLDFANPELDCSATLLKLV